MVKRCPRRRRQRNWRDIAREASVDTWRQSLHADEIQQALQEVLNEMPDLESQGVNGAEFQAVVRSLMKYPVTTERADIRMFTTRLLDVMREAHELMKSVCCHQLPTK